MFSLTAYLNRPLFLDFFASMHHTSSYSSGTFWSLPCCYMPLLPEWLPCCQSRHPSPELLHSITFCFVQLPVKQLATCRLTHTKKAKINDLLKQRWYAKHPRKVICSVFVSQMEESVFIAPCDKCLLLQSSTSFFFSVDFVLLS